MAVGAENVFSDSNMGLTPCQGLVHPQLPPGNAPPCTLRLLQDLLPSFWEAHSSEPSGQTKQHLQSRLSPLQPSRGKEPLPDGQEKAGVTGEGERGSRGGAGEQGCGGSIKHLLGGYLGISQVLTDKLARLIRAIKAVWARVVS